MRKILVFIICIALAAELVWLYSRKQESLSRQGGVASRRVPAEAGKPVPRKPAAPEPGVPAGPGEIRGLLRGADGMPASGVRVTAVPVGEIPAPAAANGPAWSSVTDTKGDFVFTFLPVGGYILSGARDTEHFAARVLLTQGLPLAEVQPSLAPAYPLRGRVVDARGKDTAGVKVISLPPLDPHGGESWQGSLPDYSWLPALTNDKGQFIIEYLPAAPWRLLLISEGNGGLLTDVVEPPASNLTFVLHRGARVRLALAMPDGAGAGGGVKVELVEREYGLERHAGLTGDDGALEFGGVRPARWSVVLHHPVLSLPEAARVIEVPAGEQELAVSITLQAGGRIEGRVLRGTRDEGLAEITVEAAAQDSGTVFQAATNKQGVYQIDHLPSGVYVVSPQLPPELHPLGVDSATVRVETGATAVAPDFQLERGANLQGTVVDPRGSAVRNALVRLEFAGEDLPAREVRSGNDGKFLFKGLHENAAVRVSASSKGMVTARPATRVVSRTGITGVKLELSQPSRGGISGEVVNAQGRPVKEAVVRCQPEGETGAGVQSVRTDRFGAFQFSGLVPGEYTLTAGLSEDALAVNSALKVTLAPNQVVRDAQVLLP